MERESINKYLKIFSANFIILSLLEIITFIILNNMPLIISSVEVPIGPFLFSGSFTIIGALCWILIMLTVCCFILLGCFIRLVLLKRDIKMEYFAKFCILIGLIIIIGVFLKMTMFFLIQNQPNIAGYEVFWDLMMDPNVTSLLIILLWYFFSAVSSVFIVLGIIIAAGGMNISLKIEKEQESRT